MKHQYNSEYRTTPRKIKLIGVGYFGHYAFVLLAALPFLFNIDAYIQDFNGTYDGIMPVEEIFDTTSPFLFIAFLLLLVQYYRLRFKSIIIDISAETVIEICSKIAKINNWEIKHKSKNRFVATSEGFLSLGFWGEMITVIIIENKVYLNSICDPYKRPNIVSFGMNRLNTKEIIKQIGNASA